MNLSEELATNFYRWEQRGRGVELFPAPVGLEPPFVAFPGHRIKIGSQNAKGRNFDTGAKPTFLSRLTDKVFRALQPPKPGALIVREAPAEDEAEPMPDWFGEKEPVMEISLRLPGGVAYPAETMAHFLTTLSLVPGIVGLEVIGTAEEITVQLVCQPEEAKLVVPQMQAHFPEAKLTWSQRNLFSVWSDDDGLSERLVLDFGLYREFMRPLETGSRIDPFVSLIGGMAHLAEGEVAVYQVLFTPLRAPWAENALAAVTKENGKPFFDDGADLVKQTQTKMARPLYGVVVRLAAKAPAESGLRRTWDIVRGMAPALRLYSSEGGQSLMPLSNKDYDHEEHCDDLLWRRSRRCGMILNLDELVALAHWPSPAVKSAKLARVVESRTRRAPEWADEDIVAGTLILGANDHDGESMAVILSERERLQHMHCIGASGTGKSTLLLSMIRQDMDTGRGLALLDPHGDLIDKVLTCIPPERLADVVIIDPSDEGFVTPLNVLSAHSDYEKSLLASDLVSVFRRLSTSWGDRMSIVFQNLVLAFLEHREGGTLADMRTFLQDEEWRREFLTGVTDPDVRLYWERTFPRLDGVKSIGPILTRLEVLLTPKVIRYMVSQRENRIDFGSIMDESKILLVRLPMGMIGNEVTWMLGSLIMVKLQQMAMARARVAARERTPFFCYVDECQHFVTPSMAEILAGARKYGLGLILAHQDLHQLSTSSEVAAAVMTNAATRIVFKVSEKDANTLAGGFNHFEAKDFANLPNFQAIARIGRADADFNLAVVMPQAPDEAEGEECREAAIAYSRETYALPRAEVEAEMFAKLTAELERTTKKPTKRDAAKEAKAVTNAPDKPGITERVTGSEKSMTPPPAEEKVRTSEVLDLAEAASEAVPRPVPPKPAGMGRGGANHKIIVDRLAIEGGKLGFRPTKEAEVAGGRADLALETTRRRIAVEVAVHSNTAHELENLTKCLEGGFNFVASVSPEANVIDNIKAAAKKALKPAEFKKLKFLSPDECIHWLTELADEDAKHDAPPTEVTKTARGRKFRVRHRETTPEERRKLEAEQITVIADLVNRNRGDASERV